MTFRPPQTPPLLNAPAADARAALRRVLVPDGDGKRSLTEPEQALVAALTDSGPPPWLILPADASALAERTNRKRRFVFGE